MKTNAVDPHNDLLNPGRPLRSRITLRAGAPLRALGLPDVPCDALHALQPLAPRERLPRHARRPPGRAAQLRSLGRPEVAEHAASCS